MEKYYVVKYTGPFGFIKPWTAVRDELTFSQLYLTGSILKGMSQKLFGLDEMNKILRHRLSYAQLVETQERTLPKLVKTAKARGILKRRIMLNPELNLAFGTMEDATIAAAQHLCLCRNEDIVWPAGPITMSEESFNALPGFEYFPKGELEGGIFHGWDRTIMDDAGYHQKQYGTISRIGEPMRLGENFITGKKDNEVF
jgi:hypothetical protein